MKENKPFYCFDGIDGLGVLLDGSCGFELRNFKPEDGKSYPCVRILPLKHKQEVGKLKDDNEVLTDATFIEVAFGSEKSVDVMIEVLTYLKNECFKESGELWNTK